MQCNRHALSASCPAYTVVRNSCAFGTDGSEWLSLAVDTLKADMTLSIGSQIESILCTSCYKPGVYAESNIYTNRRQ